MKLSEYIVRLNEIAKEHPDFEVVYAVDEEGNSFCPVFYLPCVGEFKNGEFKTEANLQNKDKVNAVCLN